MIENNVVPFEPEDLECASCGGRSVRTELVTEPFDYGTGPEPVRLSATVPLRTCQDCGFQFTDHFGETARHEAVCRHLGVMTPREVEGVRTRLKMSRAAFAEVTRLGEASLARWEKALLIQNGANDQLLFLLTIPGNLEALRSRGSKEETSWPRPVFRCLSNPERKREEGASFQLRLAAGL